MSSEKYGYDANGNRTSVESITSTGSTKRTYAYDSINQLTKETWANGTINDYTYDGFGNRTSVKVTKPGASPVTTTETFNTGNQITSFGNEASPTMPMGIDYQTDSLRILGMRPTS